MLCLSLFHITCITVFPWHMSCVLLEYSCDTAHHIREPILLSVQGVKEGQEYFISALFDSDLHSLNGMIHDDCIIGT